MSEALQEKLSIELSKSYFLIGRSGLWFVESDTNCQKKGGNPLSQPPKLAKV